MPLAAVPILHRWEDDGRHFLLIRRSLSDPQEKRYSLVFAAPGTTLQEMVQASGARWHIEEDFANAKDLGLDHYEVRSFVGWYRHITLVLLAASYLTGICATERSATVPPTTASPASPAEVLALTVVSRVPSARTAHLACSFVRTPGAGMPRGGGALTNIVPAIPIRNVVVISWLILASPFSTRMAHLSALLPDLLALSGKSGRSRTFPGAIVRLVSSCVLL
jgi:hypothetical protein